MRRFILEDFGEDVQYVIDKIQQLVELGGEDATLLTAEDKQKLDTIGVEYDTTEYWNAHPDYVPKKGVVVIYSDYRTIERNGRTLYVPGIKIGSGNAYLIDLAFVGQDVSETLQTHVADNLIHVNNGDRQFWGNKLNLDDNVVDETLVFNRN